MAERIVKSANYIQYAFWWVMIIILIALAYQNTQMTKAVNKLSADIHASNHLTDLSGKRRVREVNAAQKRVDQLTQALIYCKIPEFIEQKKPTVKQDAK